MDFTFGDWDVDKWEKAVGEKAKYSFATWGAEPDIF
jgi:hypothetical protein